jgi:hypothetical protein
MPHNPLFYSVHDPIKLGNLRDQVQIALAIADADTLKSLLVNCIPAITQPQQIGAVLSQVGVATQLDQAAEAVLHFEAIACVLASQTVEMANTEPDSIRESRELARFHYESEIHVLGRNLALAPTISLLAEAGFVPKQIQDILRLPQDCWHKSWWYAIDVNQDFTSPFLRQIRLVRYPDGSFTVQYKDLFEQTKPSCFRSLPQKVLIAIRTEGQGFAATLQQINQQRKALNISQVILICDRISELEMHGFMSQGISVYPAIEVVLPTQANCIACGRKECPMNGVAASLVLVCQGFLPESEFV